jgi:hypothetical protein
MNTLAPEYVSNTGLTVDPGGLKSLRSIREWIVWMAG